MTVRVRRAAATSMASSRSCVGGVISRSLLSGSHRVRTPIEASTSRIRLTSSMRARLRSVVRPRLSRDAQSSATAAFFDVLTSIEPDRCLPPTMRRCWGPEWPTETNSESSASPILASMSRLRFCRPDSIRVTALCEVPSSPASSDWVIPLWRRASRIRPPMRVK